MSQTLNLNAILQQTKTRWLKTNEIYTILLNISTTNLKEMALLKLPYQPCSGEVFIIDGATPNKKWKNDGYSYLPRKTGIGFREDIEKLKIAGIKEIICYYSYITQPTLMNGTISNEIVLNRRIYKLMKNSENEKSYFLVHYLKENSNALQFSTQSEQTTEKYYVGQNSFPNYSPSSFNFNESPIEDKNYFDLNTFPPKEQEIMFFDKEFDGVEGPNLEENHEFCANYLQENGNFEENFEKKQNSQKKEIISNQTQANSINNDHNGNFQALQNRIMELEARIHDLEFEKQSVSIHNNTNSTVSNSVFSTIQNNNNLFQDYKIKINDFSPEWDFVEGGTKMMICFSPNLMIPTEDQTNKLTILFGEVEARAFCIQPGVIKCYVPPHPKGFVKLSVFYNQERVDDCLDKSSMFEYRKANRNKRKLNDKIDVFNLEKEDSQKVSHDFKVRIIEKLSNFHQNLSVFSNSNKMGTQEKNWSFEEIQQVLDEFIKGSETFDVLAFNKIFQMIMQKAQETGCSINKIREFLNELNQEGFALIHYLMLLNFYDTIPLLAKYHVDLNICSKGGITPLQIAIAFNYEHEVEMLIKHGVISPNNLNNNTPSNKNLLDENFANLDVLFKNSHILDMLLREVTLQDSINNSNSVHTEKFSCNNQDDQEEENYFNILDLLNDMEEKLVVNSDEEAKIKNKEKSEKNKQNLDSKKHKYLKKKKDIKKKDSQQQNLANELKNKEAYVKHQDRIRMIQKNVRGWLLRRQYLDIKYAARVLQNYIRGKIAKKQMTPEYKLLIKNQLKNWLNLKC